MGLLGRMFGGGEEPGPVPEWASFFDSGQYREFDTHLSDEPVRRDIACEFEDDRSGAKVVSGEYEGHILGFFNLAQICHRLPRRQWREAIRQHFDRILTVGAAAESATSALEKDFE